MELFRGNAINAIEAQLVNYFENIFNPFLAAFRSGFGARLKNISVCPNPTHHSKLLYLITL
jgi:hypothetical protein